MDLRRSHPAFAREQMHLLGFLTHKENAGILPTVSGCVARNTQEKHWVDSIQPVEQRSALNKIKAEVAVDQALLDKYEKNAKGVAIAMFKQQVAALAKTSIFSLLSRDILELMWDFMIYLPTEPLLRGWPAPLRGWPRRALFYVADDGRLCAKYLHVSVVGAHLLNVRRAPPPAARAARAIGSSVTARASRRRMAPSRRSTSRTRARRCCARSSR